MLKELRCGLLLIWLVIFAAGCQGTALEQPDYWPTESWRKSSPEEQGVSSKKLAEMLELVQAEGYAIDSIMVVRNGYVVLDTTIYPFDQDARHIIYSCTKSVVSALVGIAIDRGAIDGVNQPVTTFFPSLNMQNLDSWKQEMTLEDLLTMRSGLACRDSYLYRWQGLREMEQSDNWAAHILSLPMAEAPGSRFEYCNGASFLLSAIVQEATGQTALAYAQENLFGPLGIEDVDWKSNPQGINIGWSDLYMRPADMAKIGLLYLQEGVWDGQQIISTDWIRDSTRSYGDATLQDGYGYQWWVSDSGVYMALGYAGQFIFVVPQKGMVVVFTSDLPEDQFTVPLELLSQYIIPAAADTSPSAPDLESQAALESLVTALGVP